MPVSDPICMYLLFPEELGKSWGCPSWKVKQMMNSVGLLDMDSKSTGSQTDRGEKHRGS